MKRIFSLVAALAVVFAAVGFGPAVAVGQEQAGNATATETSTETPAPTSSPTPTETPTPDTSGNGEQSADEPTDSDPDAEGNISEVSGTVVDSDITLTRWTYSEGTFSLTFEHSGERPKSMTLTEATQPGEGAQRYTIRQERILPGRSTITMNTRINGDESAIGITTEETVANGHGIVVSTGDQGANPFRSFGGTSGVLSGAGITMALSGLAAAFVIWREESGVIEA